MTVLNLIKMKDRQLSEKSEGRIISVLSWKNRKFNEHMLERFPSMLGLNLTLIKSNPQYEKALNYGAINS
jgi:hypothetical protein